MDLFLLKRNKPQSSTVELIDSNMPLETNVRFTSLDDIFLDESMVGRLIFLIITRLDIPYVFRIDSQFMFAPRTNHYAILFFASFNMLRVHLFMAFITLLTYSLILRVYSDVDFSGDPTDRHFTIGFCIFLGDSFVSWWSKKQTLTTCSSNEAKYRTMTNTTSEIFRIRCLLEDLDICQQPSIDP